MNNKIVIGRKDKVDLPDFQIYNINAKVDTGAYTSSIHCTKIKLIDGVLHFQIPGLIEKEVKDFHTETYSIKNVKSSNGKTESRFTIKTHIKLFGRTYQTEFTLTDRSKMKYPILLGRKVITKRFLVDVSKKNLSYTLKSQ